MTACFGRARPNDDLLEPERRTLFVVTKYSESLVCGLVVVDLRSWARVSGCRQSFCHAEFASSDKLKQLHRPWDNVCEIHGLRSRHTVATSVDTQNIEIVAAERTLSPRLTCLATFECFSVALSQVRVRKSYTVPRAQSGVLPVPSLVLSVPQGTSLPRALIRHSINSAIDTFHCSL